MKIFRIIRKNVKDAFKSIFRNFSLSMASVSCTSITLILVSIALLVTYNVNSITRSIEDVLTIIVFVDKNATDQDIENVRFQIESNSNVDKKEVIYRTKEEIKESLSEDEDLKSVFDTLDENPIQSAFVVKVKDLKKITDTANSFKNIPFVKQVKYGESLVNRLLSMFDIIRNACIIACIALILVTAFLIGNTIKITIFARRQEIAIMRLVGTSNTVIRMPFLIEGFVLGFIGAIVPILLTIYGYTFLYDYVGGRLFTDLIVLVKPSEIIYATSLVLLIVGGLVGMFGSLRAVRRYLKI
ncbi:MAG: permease-like cell division protein FtsX [Bacilli bacterium]|nr:permease-like cell division protein FtsX [Bacilli bacterium]